MINGIFITREGTSTTYCENYFYTFASLRRLLIIIKIRGFTSADMATCKSVLSHCYLGDWFVLYQLGKNMDPMIFREFMEKLHKRMFERIPNGSMG